MSVPDPRVVADLEERRIAGAIGAGVGESRAWLDGVLCYGGVGSSANMALGRFDHETPATGGDVAEMASWFESRGVEPRIQMSQFGDASLVRELGAAGFRFVGFDIVYARALDGRVGRAALPEGISIETVDRDDDEGLETYVRVTTRIDADGEPPEAVVANARRIVRLPSVVVLLARAGGEVVGGGALHVVGELATLAGADVKKEHRRRGIQRAMIEHRIRVAQERGARVMSVTSAPGVATERNAMRCGFAPSYTKVSLRRPGEGLAGFPGA